MRVLYEDNHLLVVVKPAGVPSQQDASGDADMLTLAKAYIKKKHSKPGQVYLGLVHRLDRPTAGVMVFARTSKAAARLSMQMRKGMFQKKYLAIVHGAVPGVGSLEDYLLKDDRENVVSVAPRRAEGAKHARLSYAPIAVKKNKTLVDISLETGRSHQIRVQFASRGMPLVGDVKYGKGERCGLALFAYKLSFLHPTKKESMVFKALPEQPVFQVFERELAQYSEAT